MTERSASKVKPRWSPWTSLPSKARFALALSFAAMAGSACAPRNSGQAVAPRNGSGADAKEMNERLAQSLEALSDVEVIYSDVLGEGEGAWDSDPRYPGKQVNCVVWLRQVIAETYGQTPADRQKVMDRLRYYGGHPAFAMRKHYGVRWMSFDPKPLVPLDLTACAPNKKRNITLELELFRKNHGYSCPLYREKERKFEFEYTGSEDLPGCAAKLDAGLYLAFAVASQGYIERYGKKSGPMGLVHGIIIEIDAVADGTVRQPSDMRIYHATINPPTVSVEALGEYVERMKGSRHDGYQLYTLDPNWDFHLPVEVDAESRRAAKCEASLGEPGSSRGMHELPPSPPASDSDDDEESDDEESNEDESDDEGAEASDAAAKSTSAPR